MSYTYVLRDNGQITTIVSSTTTVPLTILAPARIAREAERLISQHADGGFGVQLRLKHDDALDSAPYAMLLLAWAIQGRVCSKSLEKCLIHAKSGTPTVENAPLGYIAGVRARENDLTLLVGDARKLHFESRRSHAHVIGAPRLASHAETLPGSSPFPGSSSYPEKGPGETVLDCLLSARSKTVTVPYMARPLGGTQGIEYLPQPFVEAIAKRKVIFLAGSREWAQGMAYAISMLVPERAPKDVDRYRIECDLHPGILVPTNCNLPVTPPPWAWLEALDACERAAAGGVLVTDMANTGSTIALFERAVGLRVYIVNPTKLALLRACDYAPERYGFTLFQLRDHDHFVSFDVARDMIQEGWSRIEKITRPKLRKE